MSDRVAPVVSALILAAGRSERYGKRNKLLVSVTGQPMLSAVLESTATPGVNRTLVVTGHDAESVTPLVLARQRLCPERRIDIQHNPEYETGMASSIVCGVSALSESAAVIVCLADMPWVASSVLEQLITAHFQNSRASMVIPVFNGQRGNPVLIAASLFPQVLGLSGETGARQLTRQYPEQIHECAVTSDAVLRDCDYCDSDSGL